MTKQRRWKKGQVVSLTVVLVLVIVLSLVITTYIWGRSLLEAQQTRTTVNYMQTKLLHIRAAAIQISHEGLNATRIIRINVPDGKLIVYNGSHCSKGSVSRNGIVYNITKSKQLIDSKNWIIIDPRENNKSCSVSYRNNNAGILLGQASRTAAEWTNSYMMWFRQLNDTSGTGYLINITPGAVSEVSGGTHTLVLRNIGTVNITNGGVTVIYTNIIVDFY